MSEIIKRALDVEMEQHKAQIARVREEITAQVTVRVIDQVTAQVAQQVAEHMSAQMQAYEAHICQLVEGSRVVTSKPEVTNVMALARVIYRFSIDSRSGNNILLLFLIW
jgi:phosphoribosylaminoimidazole carboxylase (NCAIR synthetase)